MAEEKKTKVELLRELPQIVQQLDGFRAGTNNHKPASISFADFLKEKYALSQEQYLKELGIDTKSTTMQNIFTMPDPSYRWLVPEIIRSAIDLGIREAPFYPSLIASEQSINGLSAIMPIINPSDAAPARVNEAETIPVGDVSFGQKTVTLFKIGRGFKLTDEVKNYVSLDVLAIFLRDFGVQLGYAMDTLAMDTLTNGNAANGSEAAPVIGVGSTTEGITYKDLLRIWIRGSRLGRTFTNMIGGEDQALAILDLPEFKLRQQGTPQATLNLKTPVPNSANFFIHPGVDGKQVMLVDPRFALIKLNAQSLMLESERIVSNQTEATYATLTTGFSKMYQDAAILLDASKAFTDNGFPDYMDIDKYTIFGIEG